MPKFSDIVRFDGSIVSGLGGDAIKVRRQRITAEMLAGLADEDVSEAFAFWTPPIGTILFGTFVKVHRLGIDDPEDPTIASLVLDMGSVANPDLYVDNLNILLGSGSAVFSRQAGDATPPVYGTPLASAVALQTTITANVDLNTITELDIEIFQPHFLFTDPYA